MSLAKILLWILFVGTLLGIGCVIAKFGEPRGNYGFLTLILEIIELSFIVYLLFWSGVF